MSFLLVPIRVRTGCPHEEGRLVRWGKRLVAVLVQLSEPHGDDAGKWIVEEGFELGDAAGNEVIDSLGETETLFDRHLGAGSILPPVGGVRIPTEAGHLFRREAGQRSDLMSATIPR